MWICTYVYPMTNISHTSYLEIIADKKAAFPGAPRRKHWSNVLAKTIFACDASDVCRGLLAMSADQKWHQYQSTRDRIDSWSMIDPQITPKGSTGRIELINNPLEGEPHGKGGTTCCSRCNSFCVAFNFWLAGVCSGVTWLFLPLPSQRRVSY